MRAFAISIAALALLAFAPGAFAATLAVDGSGNLVYAASAGHVSALEFDETGAGEVTVHEVTQGGSMNLGFQTFGPYTDDDAITAGTDCTAGADDTSGNPTFVCTGVTAIQATTLDGNDALDGSGQLAGVGSAGLATIPLNADLGADNDSAIGGRADDTIHGGDGDDNIGGDTGGSGGGSNDTLFGDAGSDSVAGGSGNDTIDGGAGDDSGLVGGPGADTISGGDGNDQFIAGGPGGDTLNGNAGDDTIYGDCDGSCGIGSGGNDVINGGDGNDAVRGEQGNDTLDGGAGSDEAAGGPGDDVVNGGDGDDYNVTGGPGNDTVNGGAGDDYVTGDCGGYNRCGAGTDGNDTVLGGAGSDYSDADGGTDTIDLGTGIDTVTYQVIVNGATHPVSVTLDGAANDGGAGENDNVVNTEDVNTNDCCGGPPPGSATIVGDAGTNDLEGSSANDTIDGGAGNDFLYGWSGDDTINANDGFADRVDCGPGNDVANVDEFDQVSDNCETVNRTTRGSLSTEDKPPTVQWTAPASGAKLSTSSANTLTVTAADDKGISQVIFLAGERVICTATAAPYTCSYKPTDADVGRTTLTAMAVDTSQQTATAIRVVTVPRFKPSKVSIKTTPKKSTKTPHKFTTTGKVTRPSGVSAAAGCTGTVAVTFKAGSKTISTRRAKLSKSCTFRSKVTFSIPSRLHPKSLHVQATFRGNAVMTSRSSKRITVKV